MKKILFLAVILFASPLIADERPEDIFPGQLDPGLIALMIEAKEHALNREYDKAMQACEKLERDYPGNPAGPTGKVTLYQVMMLENDDYSYDEELRDAAELADQRLEIFMDTAPKNSWYYTLAGACQGIQGIYFLRRAEYFKAVSLGLPALINMQTAAKMDPDNWEARMGMGLYIYYRSAFAKLLPIPWMDQREKGLMEVVDAGKNREYLSEIARIAEYYIRINEREYDNCRAIMDQLIEEKPHMVIYFQLAGRAMFEKGDFNEAIKYYDAQRKIDSTLYLPFFRLGECYYKLDEYKKAEQNFAMFMKRVGDSKNDYRDGALDYLKQIDKARQG